MDGKRCGCKAWIKIRDSDGSVIVSDDDHLFCAEALKRARVSDISGPILNAAGAVVTAGTPVNAGAVGTATTAVADDAVSTAGTAVTEGDADGTAGTAGTAVAADEVCTS